MHWYDRQVDQLPVLVEPRWVTTSAGRTHLLVSGPKEAPPLIVLHGMNMNAAAMSVALSQLSAIRRVYAVDIIGMPGKSTGVRPTRKGSGYPLWLSEVVAALGIAYADFLGQSFGGWLVLKLAALMPSRIRRGVLLDSGGFIPFTVKGQLVAGLMALRYMVWPSAKHLRRAAQPFYAPQVAPEPHFAELLGLTYRHTRMDIDWRGLPVLSREDLAGFHAPVFVSYGEHDVFFRAKQAVQKAKDILPGSVATEVVKGEGHVFARRAKQDLYHRIASFLEKDA